tara:strand:+ start:263 stop:751 length:489 start_codon:yes stop_codon:yes gene_type:complete
MIKFDQQILMYIVTPLNMGKVEVWDTLCSFRMWPKKTFFGLDKSKAHCFTLPKDTYQAYTDFFALSPRRLQTEIHFMINGQRFDAQIRLAVQNRTKVRKLEADSLPTRDVLQFQWKSFEETQIAIRNQLQTAYDLVNSGMKNDHQSVTFHHAGGLTFILQFD